LRLSRLTWPLALSLAVACSAVSCGPEDGTTAGGGDATDAGTAATTRANSDRANLTEGESEPVAARGVIRGVVRSALTSDPLPEVYVSAEELGASTDDAGAYVVPLLPPGPVALHAYRRGFMPDSSAVLIEAGKVTYVDLSLAPAPPPCCTLEGSWTARFELDSAGLNSRPAARRLDGRLAIEAEIADDGPPGVSVSSGSSNLDFGPVLGGDIRGAMDDLEAAVFAGDSVAVTLLPRFGDWAIELRGRVTGDSVLGTWFQRASCCGAYGSFVLVR